MKFVFVALQSISVVSYAQRMRQLCSVAHLGLHARALGFRLNITTTIVDAAITLYETEYATSVCHRDPALRTFVTTNGGNRALFAGAGSTGSRWLSCAVEVALGIEVGHYVEGNGTATQYSNPGNALRFDVLADTPVGHQFWQLYDAHERHVPVVLSLRHPDQWVRKRTLHRTASVEGGCVGAPRIAFPIWGRRRRKAAGTRAYVDQTSQALKAKAAFLVYQAFVACVAIKDHLHTVHLFDSQQDDARRILANLVAFLTHHGIGEQPPDIDAAIETCGADFGASWRAAKCKYAVRRRRGAVYFPCGVR